MEKLTLGKGRHNAHWFPSRDNFEYSLGSYRHGDGNMCNSGKNSFFFGFLALVQVHDRGVCW